MTAAWPATLPQYVLQEGYAENGRENSIRSNMEQGPAKTRKRYTSAIRKFSVALYMTAAQVDIFDAFYESDLAFGSISFTWVHPRTQASGTFRILNQPAYTPTGPNYKVQFDMELLP